MSEKEIAVQAADGGWITVDPEPQESGSYHLRTAEYADYTVLKVSSIEIGEAVDVSVFGEREHRFTMLAEDNGHGRTYLQADISDRRIEQKNGTWMLNAGPWKEVSFRWALPESAGL